MRIILAALAAILVTLPAVAEDFRTIKSKYSVKDTIDLGISIEDALKFAVSGGVLVPPSQVIHRAAGGGDAVKLPLGWAGRIAIEAGTGRWAFTRTSTENFTWKRYRGGTASDIWVGDPGKADFRNVTNFEGTDAFPMWHGGRVWTRRPSMSAKGSIRRASRAGRRRKVSPKSCR